MLCKGWLAGQSSLLRLPAAGGSCYSLQAAALRLMRPPVRPAALHTAVAHGVAAAAAAQAGGCAAAGGSTDTWGGRQGSGPRGCCCRSSCVRRSGISQQGTLRSPQGGNAWVLVRR